MDPSFVLNGAEPRLVDEWQVAPVLWNQVRRLVDERRRRGQFILTGSAVPPDDTTRHIGAGRISRLRLRPMSLFELGRSTGEVSLAALLDGVPPGAGRTEPGVERLAERISLGGWPGHLDVPPTGALIANRDYMEDICRADLERVDGVRRDPERVRRFLQSLARNVATTASLATIARDVGRPEGALAPATTRRYMAALERLMVVENQPPWTPRLRSRSRLRTAPKRHFVDPSLAVAALNASPAHLLRNFEWFGFLFESMIVRDLRVYAQSAGARVFHYRDNTGLEVDAIVEAGPGCWAAFEIKLGVARVEAAAVSLLRFAERVDTRALGPPAALGVIVGSGYGYRRPDGVSVIPCGTLGP